jgi:O-acetyl-ADP-ribose deacetylase
MTSTRVVVGDITRLEEQGITADAVVNAANERLAAGSGVCGAIFAAAGPAELRAACDAIGGCAPGAAVATPAFGLGAHGVRHIVHAVGPVFGAHSPEEADRLLGSAYRSVLAVAEELGARTVAIPAISTGIYGFPERRAAAIAAHECTTHEGSIDEVLLVAFDSAAASVLTAALAST